MSVDVFTDDDVRRDTGWAATGYAGNLQRMSWCHSRAVADRAGADTAFFFMNPDSVWANGAFRRADELQRSGVRAVMALGLNTVAPEVQAALAPYHRGGPSPVIDVSPRDLVAITMQSLHPLVLARVVTRGGNRFRSAYFWPVGRAGFVARCFYLHPILVRPAVDLGGIPCTVDYRYVQQVCPPDAVHVVTDSDELYYIDLAELGHVPFGYPLSNHTRPRVLDWITEWTDSWHREVYARRTILVHRGPVGPAWDAARAEADRFLGDLLSEFEVRTGGRDRCCPSNLPPASPPASVTPPLAVLSAPPPGLAPVRRPLWWRAARRLRREIRRTARFARRVARALVRLPRRIAAGVVRRVYRVLTGRLNRRIAVLEAELRDSREWLQRLNIYTGRLYDRVGQLEALNEVVQKTLGIPGDAPPDDLKPFLMRFEYDTTRRLADLEARVAAAEGAVAPPGPLRKCG